MSLFNEESKPKSMPSITVTTETDVDLDEFEFNEILNYVKGQGYHVQDAVVGSNPTGVNITLTGSLQDSFLEEAITTAYAKHGHKLADLISAL